MDYRSNKLLYTLIAGILILLVTSGIGLVSYQEQRELEQVRLERAIEESVQASREADQNEREAEQQARIAEEQNRVAEQAQAEAVLARKHADKMKALAEEAQKQAEMAEARLRTSEAFLKEQQKRAEMASGLARMDNLEAAHIRCVEQGKVMARKVMEMNTNPELTALIAVHAFRLTVEHKGNPRDHDIYKGLYHALEMFKDPIIANLPTDGTGATSLETMVVTLCSHLTRNMTREEWNTFVGAGLPYEKTCENPPMNDR